MDGVAVVYSTFPDVEGAEAEGRALLGSGLAACVNILPGMVSLYIWEGRLCRENEVVMIIKTRRSLIDEVIAAVRARHTYANPALLTFEVGSGWAPFLAWICDNTVPAGQPT
jgi:periplasmic divalent cation tolerance protein